MAKKSDGATCAEVFAIGITLAIVCGIILGLVVNGVNNPIVTDDVLTAASRNDCLKHQILTKLHEPVRRYHMAEFKRTCEALGELQLQKSLIRAKYD